MHRDRGGSWTRAFHTVTRLTLMDRLVVVALLAIFTVLLTPFFYSVFVTGTTDPLWSAARP